MTFSVREATMRDADKVIEMLSLLHWEMESRGGLVRPGERTERWMRTLVGEAIARKAGLVLVAVPHNKDSQVVACLVAVDTELPYDSPYKKIAAGVGTYVENDWRKHGVATTLYGVAAQMLSDRGYDAYLGAHLTGNETAARVIKSVGFEPFEVSVLMDLGD